MKSIDGAFPAPGTSEEPGSRTAANRTGIAGVRLCRRGLLAGMGASMVLAASGRVNGAAEPHRKGEFAEALARALARTAAVEEGPFYPYGRLPLDTDNDLLIVNDDVTPAVGEVTYLAGRLLDSRGDPIRNAMVEIWQVDSTATYLAERESRGGFDPHFQGFGRFLTGSTGEYCFRTVKPVAYRGRPAPHIHFKIRLKGREPWTTQLFIKGHPGNLRDGIYNRIGGPGAKSTVTVDFAPISRSRIGELAARFDIIQGYTVEG